MTEMPPVWLCQVRDGKHACFGLEGHEGQHACCCGERLEGMEEQHG